MTTVRGDAAISRQDVYEAARHLAGTVVVTPVLRSAGLDRLAGCRLWLKAESLQVGGSFKIRGATVGVLRLSERGARGVLAQSTGNHGIAVAHAAARYGLPATVVLPENAPPVKVERVRAAGAHVVLAGTTLDERHRAVSELRERTGHDVLDAFDDPDVVAGQGTATLELLGQVCRAGGELDAIVVPVGGGGGAAGACLAAAGTGATVFGAEPSACNSMAVSLVAGRVTSVPPAPTIADGLTPSRVGRLPFRIAREHGLRALVVEEDAIAAAVRLAVTEARLVVEPSAAAALAGALALAGQGSHTDIGVVLTGGNINAELLCRLVGGQL